MKRFFLGICSLLFLFSCTNKAEDFDWLVGDWKRVNAEEDFKTFESWQKNKKEYAGFGYTMLENDTIFQEDLRLYKENDLWTLEVTGVNEDPTPFVLSELKPEYFVAENDTNEFPKKIIYKLQNDTLKANVSTAEFDVDFEFVKIQE